MEIMILAVASDNVNMGWLRLVGSIELEVSFAKETYKTDDILQKRPTILRSLIIVATPSPNLVAILMSDKFFFLKIRQYEVAATCRLLKSVGLFCKRDL